jgi:hypothetical protein
MAREVDSGRGKSGVRSYLGVVSVLLAVAGWGGIALAAGFKHVDWLAHLGGIAFLFLELAALGAALLGVIRMGRRSSPLGERVLLLLGFVLSLVFVVAMAMPPRPSPREGKARITVCRMNLSRLGEAMAAYCKTHDGKYPTPEMWCDLLVAEGGRLPAATFLCSKGEDGRCHYAMNLLADPRGAPDVVLLFESGGGWNQAGGPELLTTEHHRVCNVLLVDGSVATVGPDEIGGLKWRDERKAPQDARNTQFPQ